MTLSEKCRWRSRRCRALSPCARAQGWLPARLCEDQAAASFNLLGYEERAMVDSRILYHPRHFGILGHFRDIHDAGTVRRLRGMPSKTVTCSKQGRQVQTLAYLC